jgi:formate dehydrogenase subunit gamma
MGAYSFLWSAARGLFALGLPLLLVFGGGAALAQQETQAQRQQVQPGNNAPVWREVRKEGQEHYTSIKGRETGVLIQTLGQPWRELRNGWIVPIAGWFFVAFACVLGLYYLTRGPWKLRAKPTGRLIERFAESSAGRTGPWRSAFASLA